MRQTPGINTVSHVLAQAEAVFSSDSPRADAEILLAAVLGKARSWLYAFPEASLSEEQSRRFAGLMQRRARGEPVAHLLGHRDFWSMQLSVTCDTLIPRPETELLVELALHFSAGRAGCRMLDLGAGTGAVALALATERPDAHVTAIEADARTLAVAVRNAARLGLQRVRILHGNWFSPVAGERFDLIASNPPYLATDDPHLLKGDLRYEPRAALTSGNDGLDDIRAISAAAPAHMTRGAWLLLEHGYEQGPEVRKIMRDCGLANIETFRDLGNQERVTLGQAQ